MEQEITNTMIRVKEGLHSVTHVTHNRRFTHIYARRLLSLFSCSGRNAMNEKTIERKLTAMVMTRGGIAVKLAATGISGMPDRLILIAIGKIGFVEVKAPKKKPRKLQKIRHKQLQELGFQVYVLDKESQIGGIIDAIRSS